MSKVITNPTDEILERTDLTGIVELFIDNGRLTRISYLPNSLIALYCSENQIVEISHLPFKLERLSCSDNNLTELPELPDTLLNLFCANNLLTHIPNLPEGLRFLDIRNNPLEELPELPFGLVSYNKSQDSAKIIKLEQYNTKREKMGLEPVNKMPSKDEWNFVNSFYTDPERLLKEFNFRLKTLGYLETNQVPDANKWFEIDEQMKQILDIPQSEMFKQAESSWRRGVQTQEVYSAFPMLSTMPLLDVSRMIGWFGTEKEDVHGRPIGPQIDWVDWSNPKWSNKYNAQIFLVHNKDGTSNWRLKDELEAELQRQQNYRALDEGFLSACEEELNDDDDNETYYARQRASSSDSTSLGSSSSENVYWGPKNRRVRSSSSSSENVKRVPPRKKVPMKRARRSSSSSSSTSRRRATNSTRR